MATGPLATGLLVTGLLATGGGGAISRVMTEERDKSTAPPAFKAHVIGKPAPAPAPPAPTGPADTQPAAAKPPRPDDPTTWPKEVGGPKGPEPTRYGDWERNGICSDF